MKRNIGKKFLKKLEEIKIKHNIGKNSEIKWSRISMNKINFYKEIIDYFFKDEYLSFRGLVVRNKNLLNHEEYNQTHDEWYYKMYFQLLSRIINNTMKNEIYLDIKDTKGISRDINYKKFYLIIYMILTRILYIIYKL